MPPTPTLDASAAHPPLSGKRPDPVTQAFTDLIARLREAALADGADYDRVTGFLRKQQDQLRRWTAGETANPSRGRGAAQAEG